jgi:hypothetical protein
MDFKIGARVRFIEHHRPLAVEPDAVGVVVTVEQASTRWQPRVRVRFDNYLSGWIWSHVLVHA